MSQLQQLRLLVMAQLVDNWDPEMVSIKWDARNSLNSAEGRIYKFTLGGWEQERRIPLLLAWARGDGCLVSHGGCCCSLLLTDSLHLGFSPPIPLPLAVRATRRAPHHLWSLQPEPRPPPTLMSSQSSVIIYTWAFSQPGELRWLANLWLWTWRAADTLTNVYV